MTFIWSLVSSQRAERRVGERRRYGPTKVYHLANDAGKHAPKQAMCGQTFFSAGGHVRADTAPTYLTPCIRCFPPEA